MSEVITTAPVVATTPTPESTSAAELSQDSSAPVDNQEVSSEEEQIDEAVAAGEITKQEAKDLKKKYKLKVDGVESEVEIDLSNDEEVTKILQMAKAFQKRGGEFTKAQEQLLAKMKEIESDPEKYLESKGVDLDAKAEERLRKKIAELEKSPEQKEKEQFQAELEQLRKEKAEAEAEKAKIATERARDEQAKIISDEITAAITKAGSKLPDKDPYFMQQMSAYMLSQMAEGNYDISVEDTVKVLEKNMKKDLNGFFNRLDEDSILEFISPENYERLRKKMLSNKKAAIAPNSQTTTAKQVVQDTGTKKPVEDDQPRQKKSMKTFFGAV